MLYQLVLSPDAIADIDKAVNYYNGLSFGLGFEFTDTLDRYFKALRIYLPLRLPATLMYVLIHRHFSFHYSFYHLRQ